MQISGVTIQGGMNILPAGGSPSPSGPTDPNFDNVSLLLSGDGSNGSTTFTDLSSNSHTVTAVGDTQISTSIKKFGTGSVKFDGSGDYLIAGENLELAPGAGDFTVEFWMYGITGGNNFYNGLYQNYTNAENRTTALRINTHNADQTSLMVQTAATGLITTSSGVVTSDAWNHVALVRNGSSLVLYVNGVSAGSTTNTTNFSDGYAIIGNARYGSNDYLFAGYIDDFRITKGVARYTSNFTAPTAAFPTS